MSDNQAGTQREFAGRELVEQTFAEELALITGQLAAELAVKALSVVHPKFFSYPASASGKYHPLYALGEGGVVRHTRAGVWMLRQMLVVDAFRQKFSLAQIDQMIIAVLLHDSCKYGVDWENQHTVNEHPELVIQLSKYMELSEWEEETWGEVNLMIASHMGQWGVRDKHNLKYPVLTDAQLAVHLSDFMASRAELDLSIFGEGYEAPTERKDIRFDKLPRGYKQVWSQWKEKDFYVKVTQDFANNFHKGQELHIQIQDDGQWLVDDVAFMYSGSVQPYALPLVRGITDETGSDVDEDTDETEEPVGVQENDGLPPVNSFFLTTEELGWFTDLRRRSIKKSMRKLDGVIPFVDNITSRHEYDYYVSSMKEYLDGGEIFERFDGDVGRK